MSYQPPNAEILFGGFSFKNVYGFWHPSIYFADLKLSYNFHENPTGNDESQKIFAPENFETLSAWTNFRNCMRFTSKLRAQTDFPTCFSLAYEWRTRGETSFITYNAKTSPIGKSFIDLPMDIGPLAAMRLSLVVSFEVIRT